MFSLYVYVIGFVVIVAHVAHAYFDRKTKLLVEREKINAMLKQRQLIEDERRASQLQTLEAVKELGKRHKNESSQTSQPNEPIITPKDPFVTSTVQHALPAQDFPAPEDVALQDIGVFTTEDDEA